VNSSLAYPTPTEETARGRAHSISIAQFANCGLATLLINSTIPGPGNTIKLKLGTPTAG
jgi:hypothetical protein